MRHLFSKLPDGTVVEGCTEHTRADQYLFRAHPAFRSERPWHDWALFKWTAESLAEEHEEEELLIPAQIILFLNVPASAVHLDVGNGMTIQTPGLYALIESLQTPLSLRDVHTEIVVPASKVYHNQYGRASKRHKCQDSNLYLVSVDTIYEPITAIPDIGGSIGDFIFVRPVDQWSYVFSDFIDITHEKYKG